MFLEFLSHQSFAQRTLDRNSASSLPPDDHCPFPNGANIVAMAWFHEPHLINYASRSICCATAGDTMHRNMASWMLLSKMEASPKAVNSVDGTADLSALLSIPLFALPLLLLAKQF